MALLEDDSQRVIHHGDGVEWLRNASLGPQDAIVTSLPDLSGLPELGFEGWRDWFIDAAEQVCRAAHDESVAIFYQTDIKREGRWVIRFLRQHTRCTTVVDPFCGHGSVLAAANAHGLSAVGVEISRKRVAKARKALVDPSHSTGPASEPWCSDRVAVKDRTS